MKKPFFKPSASLLPQPDPEGSTARYSRKIPSVMQSAALCLAEKTAGSGCQPGFQSHIITPESEKIGVAFIADMFGIVVGHRVQSRKGLCQIVHTFE